MITCIADNTWEFKDQPLNLLGSFLSPREAVKIHNMHQIPSTSIKLFSALLQLVVHKFPGTEFEVCCSALAIKINLYSGLSFPIIFQNYSFEDNILKFTNNYNLTKPKKSPRLKLESHW